jgi:hypothetical protein
VSLSTILDYLAIASVAVAFIFVVIGAARTRRHAIGFPAEEVYRLKALRRADWRSAASLLCIAFLSFALSVAERGTFFTQPSGNTAGGLLLVAAIFGLILALVLSIRYLEVSRALRALNHRTRD